MSITADSLFQNLPTTDALNTLAEKYLPPRERPDLSGGYNQSENVDTLILDRRWRAVAQYCRNAIYNSPSEDTANILSLFAIELTALFALLPTSTNLGDTSIPFELHVFLACAPSLVSQQRKVESIENLSRLIKLCKEPVWAARRLQDDKAVALWTNRVERLGMLLADLLVEHKTISSANSLLTSCTGYTSSPSILASLCRISLTTGQLGSLASNTHLLESIAESQSPAQQQMIRKMKGIELIGRAAWEEAIVEWRKIVARDSDDVEAANNLSICLLYASKLQEAINLLADFIASHPVPCGTLLFNYATMLELRTDHAGSLKVELLRNVIRQGGEGVRASCLRLS